MPHNPEAGSASQKKAIEEPIDPPFSGRLMAAFFRSKKRDKKISFYKKPKTKKEKNYKRTKELSFYQKFFNSFIFNSFLIFFFIFFAS